MLDPIGRLYAIARLVAQDADLAEDAVQDALVRCWRDLPTLRDPTRFEPWFPRPLLNAAPEQSRAAHPFEAKVPLLGDDPAADDGSRGLADRDDLQRAS